LVSTTISLIYFAEKLESAALKCTIPFEEIRLKDKSNGSEQIFNKYKESELTTIRNNTDVSTFDMTKLEVEWDYDTD
jgi:hypothetical protein